jgi:hypothetical protein
MTGKRLTQMLTDEKEERIRMTEEALKPIRDRSSGIFVISIINWVRY